MEFKRNTRNSGLSSVGKLVVKILIFLILIFIAVVLIDKIDFPAPNKKIEKIIPNENFKVIK
tara:strand:+ start:909 stop:1094 length:186 start_codon:yes stop_codon:yes gene_type:complete